MTRLFAALFLCLTAASSAGAGAWLREQGQGFTAVSAIGRSDTSLRSPHYETSLYAEYGLKPRLTLGLDANERPGSSGHALIFVRLPIRRDPGAARIAVELGLGGHHLGPQWDAMYKAALSYGRGFSGVGGGWLAIDAAVEYRSATAGPLYKLDATLGLPSKRRMRTMIQLETAYLNGAGFLWALTPSLILPGKNGREWVFGVETRSAATQTIGLKLALWKKF